MGRLRKDYLTRQRSTPFKCQAYMFMHRCCLPGGGLLLTGLSCQSGEEGNIFEQSRLAAPMLPHCSLEQCPWLGEHTHCLSPHSFPYICSHWCWKILPSGQNKFSLPSFFGRPLDPPLSSVQPFWCYSPQEYCVWPDLLIGYLLALLFLLLSAMLPEEVRYYILCLSHCANMFIFRKSTCLCISFFQFLLWNPLSVYIY